jgi:RimJ/RimL family protein N-acetyltransferase
MPWAREPNSVEDSEAYARRAQFGFIAREELQFLFLLKDSRTHIGSGGLHNINWNVPSFEIGYWQRTSFCGHGYITEAVNRLTRFAFQELKAARVQIVMDNLNERSWRVAERTGFQLEGVRRNESRNTDGELRDARVYSKIADNLAGENCGD